MFGMNYKMKVVNPTKGVVKLTPTAGTWLKMLAPSLILTVGMFLITLLQDADPVEEYAPDVPYPDSK